MPKVAKGSAFDLANYVPIIQPEKPKPKPPAPKEHQRLSPPARSQRAKRPAR